jgi:hypothetical protein
MARHLKDFELTQIQKHILKGAKAHKMMLAYTKTAGRVLKPPRNCAESHLQKVEDLEISGYQTEEPPEIEQLHSDEIPLFLGIHGLNIATSSSRNIAISHDLILPGGYNKNGRWNCDVSAGLASTSIQKTRSC